MKQVAIASGKGGTGKTSLVASFANFADAIIADCDVDAPNLHLILRPEILEKIPFEGMELAKIEEDKCIKCGKCEEACRFGAIEDSKVIEEKCEGCGVCQLVCPVDAIGLHKRVTGYIFVSRTRFGGFVYGLLSPGEEASGKLVSQVRKKAEEMANKEGKEMIIIDSPAGIGCPVIASIGNTNLVVVVTEPTMAAIHDMERVLSTAEHFRVKTVVVINKYDINEEMSKEIEEFCRRRGIDIIGKIPFSRKFVEAMIEGKSVVECDKEIAGIVKNIWENIEKMLEYESKDNL
ncbi:MAG TPA: (4Fe-4S)-binding protein [Thermoplasmatales archaeon]|nr:(4Fe-4S)-binding protein [Thermoplasmatales archaeon]